MELHHQAEAAVKIAAVIVRRRLKRIQRRQVSDALRLLQSANCLNDLLLLEVDDPDSIVAELNEEALPRQINRM